MAFDKRTKYTISFYVDAHLPDDAFYQQYFWFISDAALRVRLEEEFKAARYVYKLLEGLQVKGALLAAQCKIQILLYASIYEAVLHHVVLQDYGSTHEVAALTSFKHKKPINISGAIRATIEQKYHPAGLVSVFEEEICPVDPRKIVFEAKADAALELGLISQKTRDAVCDVYSMRNAIHLHAELKRGVTYDLQAAKSAYWRLQGFAQEISNKLVADNKVTRPLHQVKTQRATRRGFIPEWLIPLKAKFRRALGL